MTGLEKILSQIEVSCDERCAKIISDARAQAKEIIADAEAQAADAASKKKAEGDKKAESLALSASSSASLAKNRAILDGKLKIIDETLDSALEIIKALPRKEYYEILKGLVSKNVMPGEGILRLSKEDAEKLPSNFVDSLNHSFKKSTKIKLGDSIDIDGGFILVYGNIDINCSFDALVSEKRDALRDALNGLLFN